MPNSPSLSSPRRGQDVAGIESPGQAVPRHSVGETIQDEDTSDMEELCEVFWNSCSFSDSVGMARHHFYCLAIRVVKAFCCACRTFDMASDLRLCNKEFQLCLQQSILKERIDRAAFNSFILKVLTMWYVSMHSRSREDGSVPPPTGMVMGTVMVMEP